MWSWPFWKFPVAALGVLCWAVLTWSNVMTVEAMGGSDLWGGRIMMALMGCLDVVGLFIMAGIAWMLRRRSALGALGCVFLGSVCLLAEGAGAHHYLTQMTASTEAPSKEVEARRADLQTDIEREERSLESTRAAKLKAAAKGRDTDELAKSERASLAAVEQLRRSMPKTAGLQVFARFAGYELYVALLLLAISQVAFAVVQVRGEEAQARHYDIMTDAELLTILKTRTRPLVEISGNALREFPEPEGPGGNGGGKRPEANPIDRTDEGDLPAEISGPSPESGKPVRFIPRVVPQDAFTRTVLDYRRAGLSVAEIAKRLKCGKTKVYDAIKPKAVEDTTSETTRQ
jgi:hypothetical protein